MNAPRVSIVLSVYNGAPFLLEAIESVVVQTFGDFEFIIIDDGSGDASFDIATSVSDSRIRVLRNERNLGLTPSLNRGLAEARGEFLARIDADDLWRPDKLAQQVRFLDSQPNVGLVGSWYQEIDARGQTRAIGTPPTEHIDLRWALLFFCPFSHSAVLWRRTAVEREVGGYNPSFTYAMDWELWSRIAGRFDVANLPEVLASYRVSPHSMTATHPRVMEEIMECRRTTFCSVFGARDGAALFVAEQGTAFVPADGLGAGPFSRRHLRGTVDSVQRLQASFCERLALSWKEGREHRLKVRRWIADRFIFEAQQADSDAGSALLFEAARVRPLSLLTFRFARGLRNHLRWRLSRLQPF